MKKAMRSPRQYKSSFGLYKAALRALETLDGSKRGWWIQNAVTHAESDVGLNDLLLARQLRELVASAAPQTIAQLQPRN